MPSLVPHPGAVISVITLLPLSQLNDIEFPDGLSQPFSELAVIIAANNKLSHRLFTVAVCMLITFYKILQRAIDIRTLSTQIYRLYQYTFQWVFFISKIKYSSRTCRVTLYGVVRHQPTKESRTEEFKISKNIK